MPGVDVAATLTALQQPRGPRPVSWCLIDVASPTSNLLAEQLFRSWGPGIVSLSHQDRPHSDRGLGLAEASRILQGSALRVWWGGTDPFDAVTVLAALRHGCLPLQLVPARDRDQRAAELPSGLEVCLLAAGPQGELPERPSAPEQARRLDTLRQACQCGILDRALEPPRPRCQAA